MVFQSYALYPHLTVYANLAFPLRVQRQSRAVIPHKVEHIAALVQLQDLLQRKPAQLSGGQLQRVALGRALIKEPNSLLEPLGREILLSVMCGPHPLKVLVSAPCLFAPDTPVWLNLSQGPHHFFDPFTGAALGQH